MFYYITRNEVVWQIFNFYDILDDMKILKFIAGCILAVFSGCFTFLLLFTMSTFFVAAFFNRLQSMGITETIILGIFCLIPSLWVCIKIILSFSSDKKVKQKAQ